MPKKLLLVLVGVFFMATSHVDCQRFIFGAHLAANSSQVEGDKLNGFNKYGYTFGLIGGFAFSESHYIIVGPQFSTFGSKHSGERSPREINGVFVETDLSSANVQVAYMYKFGDTWTGERKYQIHAGARVHRLLRSDFNLIRFGPTEDITITKEDLSSYFLSLDIGMGINISSNFGLDLSYNHGLQNLLKEPKLNIGKLAPLYLSLGLSYYFRLPGDPRRDKSTE